MKKQNKFAKHKILYTILISIIVIIGVRSIMNELHKQNILKEQLPRIEKYLKYNYEGVSSITLTKVEVNPTGVNHIYGYINENENYSFDVSMSGIQYEGGVIFGEFQPPARHKFKDISVSEIEAKENK